MGIPYGDIALSLLKSKLVLAGGGTIAAAGVSTPIALTVTNVNTISGIVSNEELTAYFSESNLNKLIEEVKKIPQEGNSTRNSQSTPSETEKKNFLTSIQQINNGGQQNYSTLSKEQREALLVFLRLYAELEYSKTSKNKKPDDNSKVSVISALVDGLSELKWNQDEIKFFKDDSKSQESKWGWNKWDNQNPFWSIYDQDESKWIEKMKRLGSESTKDVGVAKEMEYDISSKILKEMVKVHKDYLK